jgi:tellurite resistance protein TerC
VDVPTWVWIATGVVTVAIFTFDLFVVGRRPHEPSMKECATYLSIYVGLAIIFGIGVWITWDHQHGLEFFSGWLVEYSLSIDNLFIFIIIMAKFAVPKELQQYALMIGIVTALIMRAIFIAVGAAAISNFSWIFYLFGLFLVYTAFKLAKEGGEDEDDEFEENRVVAFIEKRFPATSEWHGRELFHTEAGKRMITPMFIVIITLGTTDLLFALDSIPAIFGITKEPYLVLTANIFALMGLRQLYFLIGGLLQRLIYLSYGLAFLLAFIGVKLFFHALHENELPFINGGEHLDYPWLEIPIWLSLVVIVATLAVTAALSLFVSGRMTPEAQDAATGPRRDWEDD